MDVCFWPPLQLLACARAARGIVYAFDLKTLNYGNYDIKLVKEKVSRIRIPVVTRIASKLTNSANQKNSLPLPTNIQTQLIGTVLELGLEIDKWFQNNLLASQNNFDVRNTLSWRSIGIIDSFKTARVLIRNDSFSIKNKFYVARKYYFEEDAQRLWPKMTADQRFQIRRFSTVSVSYQQWLRALDNNTDLDWEQISLNIENEEFFCNNYVGIPYFFTRLQGREVRYKCIRSCLAHGLLRPFDLYFCLHQLKAEELNDVFTRLPKNLMHKVFESFLYWPLQIIFLDMVNSFKAHINGYIFFSLICVLLDKLQFGWEDHTYVDLFKHFWNALSSQYSSFVKKRQILVRVVKYVLNAPVPFDFKDYRNFVGNEKEKQKAKTKRCRFLDIFLPCNI
ncbi:uncharacterized protein NPIL_246281 [Nephila pilipes]|uniref:Uncharacterized protein n=1 Tax=Nephila pilipes TaxID=299642 RepID=A0A8X6QH38_NEPPI|nr:uncharacterized protein NPIL_246281 [Nephila pilipes]